MKARNNSEIWRSGSARSNEDNNTSPIASKEQSDQNQDQNQDPSLNLKITKVEITFHRHKQQFPPNIWRKLLSFKREKNHEGKS
jgi:hypothetical protein